MVLHLCIVELDYISLKQISYYYVSKALHIFAEKAFTFGTIFNFTKY